MARRLYGASAADFTFDGDKSVAGVRLAVATAPNTGARVTTKLENLAGQAVNAVTSDANGEVRFYGTDLPSDLWVAVIDAVGNTPGPWYVVRSADIGPRLDALAGEVAALPDFPAAPDAESALVFTPGTGYAWVPRGTLAGTPPLQTFHLRIPGTAAVGNVTPGNIAGLPDVPLLSYDIRADTAPAGSALRYALRRVSDGANLATFQLGAGLTSYRGTMNATIPAGTGVQIVCTEVGSTTPGAGVNITLYSRQLAGVGTSPDSTATPPVGGTTPPPPATPPAAPEGTSVVNVNDSTTGTGSLQWEFSAGWQVGANPGSWGGNDSYTSTQGATAKLRFKGRGVRLHAPRAPHHGILTVSVDGSTPVSVDLYSAAREDDQLVYWTPILPDGPHELTVTCTGSKAAASSGTVVVVDRAVVFNTDTAATPTTPTGTGFVTRQGSSIYLNGQRWWFAGYCSFVWSGNCGHDFEKMSTTQVEEWVRDHMRHDGHGLLRVFFWPGWDLNRLRHLVATCKQYNVYLNVVLDDMRADCGRPGWADAFGNATRRAQYEQHMRTLVNEFKNETTIAWWEYMNEPAYEGGGWTYRQFVEWAAGIHRAIDPNHLWSSGTLAPYHFDGTETTLNQPRFRATHESPAIDICSLHEYDMNEVMSNHYDNAVANSGGKPVYVGEFGITASQSGAGCNNSFATRASKLTAKMQAYINDPNGAGGTVWAWTPGHGSDCSHSTYSNDTQLVNALKTIQRTA